MGERLEMREMGETGEMREMRERRELTDLLGILLKLHPVAEIQNKEQTIPVLNSPSYTLPPAREQKMSKGIFLFP